MTTPSGETPRPDTDWSAGSTKPFVDHLEDLRLTVLWCAGALLAGLLVAIPLAPWVLRTLKGPLASTGVDPDTFLKVLRVAGGLSAGMRIVFWSGMLLSVPILLLAIGHFVFPGLKRRERKAVVWIIGASAVLFTAGVMMGYHLTLPVALRMMFRINALLGITCDFVDLADYMSFSLRLLIVFGLAFELPVVIVALGSVGILSYEQLRTSRRYVIVGIFVVAMLLTPPDPITQLLMALPMILLYEACIWIVWLRERAARRA